MRLRSNLTLHHAESMPKTEFLQIRLNPEQREVLRRAAEADHLDLSTWARRVLLQAVEKPETAGDADERGPAQTRKG